MTKEFSKIEHFLDVANMTDDPATTPEDLENCLYETTENNDEVLKKAGEYIDENPQTAKLSQNSQKTTTVRTNSNKASCSKSPKTSSQRQCDLIVAQQR